ncbi:hypothetical protein JCM17845_02100 [Iodidimonas gelatinilytica]|uniref:Uncharacterized protein n=1 Tax=Iodidimonas gelatinilytica TaxID=1236966 RepID=A0A5A7MUT5_9PROT|nr:hypothetical protein [Iodidimonas gelatinilytica]GEQ99586.1 hypothetical protein JCM17845_02100 [Iodidimonas gelatinilytica]
MLAHLSYRAPGELDTRFGRGLQDRTQPAYGLEPDYQVESYLAYHGRRFVERFDPASYVVITKAMDYFDLAPDGDLASRFKGARTRMFLGSYETDWLYPPEQTSELRMPFAQPACRCLTAVMKPPPAMTAFYWTSPLLMRILRSSSRLAHRNAVCRFKI